MISARFRLPSLLAVALFVASLAGAQAPSAAAPTPAAAPAPPPGAPKVPRTLDVPDGALVAAGKAADLDVLATGDVIGFIEPCG